jgi:tRNA(adenine34) deaminase
MENDDIKWMSHALDLAEKAKLHDEVPVGAVIVLNDEIIGEGWNQPIGKHDPTAHAEIQALRMACEKMSNYRLPGATLYVSLEPCIMCAGAIVHARIQRVIFSTKEPKTGAAGSYIDIFNMDQLNHKVHCEEGLLASQSSQLLRDFFKARR